MNRKSKLSLAFALLLALPLLTLGVRSAQAHERVDVGPYVIIVGWENEPAIVGERNAVVLQVTEAGAPVAGLEGTIELVVTYGGHTFTGNLAPTGAPGEYRAEIFPTVRGQYTIHLAGAIEEVVLDVDVEPEEVLSAAVLQFPESEPELRDLRAELDELRARLQIAYAIAGAGVVLALAGLALAAFGLRRARS